MPDQIPSSPLTILLADDDPEDLELIEQAIVSIEPGADLHKVLNGKAVIQFLKSRPDADLPCLIILDYNMPELTGSEVLSLLCRDQRYTHIPKVVLSTSSTPVHIHECMGNGATDYFVKPNNMRELTGLAERMLSLCNGKGS
ncbi:MAG TPA: response regulator [Flavisolibacter sp.]